MIKQVILAETLKKKLKDKKALPQQVKEKFYWCAERLLEDENHPSLRNKKIQGTENYREFSITMNYRCVYRKEQDTAFLLEIGKHEDVF